MPRLLSIAALASAAIIATMSNSPVSAAALTMNSVGGSHISAATNRGFAPNIAVSAVQLHNQEPHQKKWVCGPIVNWDGSPHFHWVPTPTYP